MPEPLVLDLDGSLGGLPDLQRISLLDWQEAIRFGCGTSTWRQFGLALDDALPRQYGTVLLGSGDFHHVTELLLRRLAVAEPCDVVVFDNHPDNMRFPFGIHCGSWVRHAARLAQVRKIHVVGIGSLDVAWRQAWENYLSPLYRGKVCYWTVGVPTGWAGAVGLGQAFQSFAHPDELIAAFLRHLEAGSGAIYLSIDKDVLDPSVARTNWDQGCLRLAAIEATIAALAGRIVGSDITGEISKYAYRTHWKRWLSARDEQPEVDAASLARWQAQQMAVNTRLLQVLQAATKHG